MGVQRLQKALGQLPVPQRVQQNAAVVVIAAYVQPDFFLSGMAQQNSQRMVHPRAEYGVDHQLMISGAVGEVFRQYGFIIRQAAGGFHLPAQYAFYGFASVRRQGKGLQAAVDALFRHGGVHFAQPFSVKPAGFQGPAHGIAFPEGRTGPLRRGGGDDHPVSGNFLNAPGKGPQQEFIPQPGLENIFLVQFPQPGAVLQRHGVPAPVGNGAHVGKGQHPGVSIPGDLAVDSIVQQPRAHGQIPGVFEISRQHFQHGFQLFPGEIPIGPRAPGQRKGFVCGVIPGGGHGDQVLGQYVQPKLRNVRRFDAFLTGTPGGQRCVQAVRFGFGIDGQPTDSSRAVAGASRPLQGPGNAPGRTDLQNQIDFAHVDAQFHGGGAAKHLNFAPAQLLFRFQTLFPGNAAVMGQGNPRPGGGVNPLSQLFRLGPAVYESQNGAAMGGVFHNSLGQRRPDAVLRQGAQVLFRQFHLHLQPLFHGRRDDFRPAAAGEERNRRFHGPHRGGQGDALQPLSTQRVQPFQRQGQMHAPLGIHQRVQFVHDDALKAGEHPPALFGGQQKIQGFRRGDENLRGMLGLPGAFCGGGVPGAHGGLHLLFQPQAL